MILASMLPTAFRLLAISCLALLTACAVTETDQTPGSVLFERDGRFLIQVTAPGRQLESVQGGFRWRQSADSWRLDLVTPMGATLARIDARPQEVVLERPGEPVRRAASAQQLLMELFAASVPVDALEDWIRGQPVALTALENVRRDGNGEIVSMSQQDWHVRFERRDDLGPRFIEVSGRDQEREVVLRMIVDSQ